MRILGISPLDRDATASFVEDGHVVFACAEERLSRNKLQDGFPYRAIELGLRVTGWTLDSIDAVAYSFFDGEAESKLMRSAFAADRTFQRGHSSGESLAKLTARGHSRVPRADCQPIPGLAAEAEFVPSKPLHKKLAYRMATGSALADRMAHRMCFRQWLAAAQKDHHVRTRQLAEGLEKLGLTSKLHRFNHHLCHAANAFYSSGYDEALILSFDGYGSGNCGGVYLGNASGIKKLHEFAFPHSLGLYYEQVTSALGFRAGRHEGKVVGLAAYGDPELIAPSLRSRFAMDDQGGFGISCGLNHYYARWLAQVFQKRDIAAAYQTVLEEVVQKITRYWVRKTGMHNVCLSGGVNANVKLNQRIHECAGVESVFVYPNMGDGGCATGAALLLCNPQMFYPYRLPAVYHGPEFQAGEIAAALDAAGLAYQQYDNVESVIAEKLADDRIVARFNGRMEYGPRALGNRSILYPAKDPGVNLWLNHQLGRTEFMPFAPAALAEHAHALFNGVSGCEHTAQFMTITFDCTDRMKQLCPAAVHVDGTARPQLVDRTTNPSFHRILEEYYSRTGTPAIINTSFNMHEEPIVCTPEDSIRAFLKGRIDYLAIGDCIVAHPELEQIRMERGNPSEATASTGYART